MSARLITVLILFVAVVGTAAYFYYYGPTRSGGSNIEADPSFTHVGGDRQDVLLIVSESIQGEWTSSDDPRFTREFRAGGVVVDSYNGEIASQGTWQAFTSVRPLDVAFPVEENTVYLKLVMSGTQDEALHFKIVKLTPETLDLIYMDRGGALTFTRSR